MNQRIPGGSFIVARKLFESEIWLKNPLYLKLWVWILGQASHSDHQKHGRTYNKGEFLTTYNKIIQAMAYYHNRQPIIPTIKQIRTVLNWLQLKEMIIVEPVSVENLTRADTRADLEAQTRAYLGIKIIVVNYGTYQDLESYKDRGKNSNKGRHQGRGLGHQGHNNNNGYKNVKEPPDFFSLRKRYSDQKLIDQVFESLASTRKSNKIADSVLLAQLQKWQKYPVEQVEAGIRIFIDKDYAAQGKREEYLLGIIRNQKVGEPKQQSTGSPLLDFHSGRSL